MRVYTRPESPNWYAEIMVHGRPRRIALDIPNQKRLRGRALQAAAEIEERLNTPAGISLEEAAIRFLEDREGWLRPATLKVYRLSLAHVISMRMDSGLADVDPAWVRAFIQDSKRAGKADIAIRKHLAALSTMMEYAREVGWEGAPDANPVRLVSKKHVLKPPERRPRSLKPEQVRAILRECRGWWLAFVTLILETGMRREEALGLTWDEVDLKRGVIILAPERVKTKKGRIVPLSDTALGTLQAIVPHTGSPHVFINPRTGRRFDRSGVGHSWQRLTERAGCKGVRIHDLRHTFASWTRQLGMARDDRMAIVGHTTEAAHEGYSETTIDVLREVVNRFSPSTVLAHDTRTRPEGAETSLPTINDINELSGTKR